MIDGCVCQTRVTAYSNRKTMYGLIFFLKNGTADETRGVEILSARPLNHPTAALLFLRRRFSYAPSAAASIKSMNI